MMYLTVKQQIKHLSKDEYLILKELCHIAKNLTNEAIYNIRQYFFNEKKYLSYVNNYHQLKNSDNYKILNSNMAQQILKEVDGSFKSFFALLKKKSKDARIPRYLDKDGHTTLVIGFVRIIDHQFVLPFSNSYRKEHKDITFSIPRILYDRKIKEIRIIPKCNARFFEIQYTYECEEIRKEMNTNNALAIDFGINNLMSAVTSSGKTFIIDGKRLKSVNQWYNKENSKLQSIKDKQKYDKRPSRKQSYLLNRRNNRVNDYMSKSARKVIDYCLCNDIDTVVIGHNNEFQKETKLSKTGNQNFVNIPFGKLRTKLKYLCELYGLTYIEQEESYTSKASFFDHDEIPVYGEENNSEYHFSGKRKHRGLYQRGNGVRINADINGALNILRKSKVVDLTVLYHRGAVDTPMRIRVA